MGTTPRDALRFPEQSDEVDVPTDIGELALDVEGQLHRAFVCTSSTRPTGIGTGFLIHETDTGATRKWDGSAWQLIGGVTGGGGGGSAGGGTWRAASAQSIPATASGPGTVIAFGTAVGTPSEVVRAAFGDGHHFTLSSAGLWVGAFVGRYASASQTGVRDFGVWCDRAGGTAFDEAVAHDGGKTVAGQPKGVTLPIADFFEAGTRLVVYGFNGTGGARTLEHSSGQWVSLRLRLVG